MFMSLNKPSHRNYELSPEPETWMGREAVGRKGKMSGSGDGEGKERNRVGGCV